MNDDLISRQAALDECIKIRYALQMMDDTQTADKMMTGLRLAEISLEEAPSAERRGHWIHHDDASYAGGGYEECSCCHWRCSEWVFIEDNDYCPHCGAKMMEEES